MIGYIKKELDFDVDSVVDDPEQKNAIIQLLTQAGSFEFAVDQI